MTWAGPDSREILQAVLQRYLEQYYVLIEFNVNAPKSEGANQLVERLYSKEPEHWVQAVENIGKRIMAVMGRKGGVVTASTLYYRESLLILTVTNVEEV